ncbi:hypothetical protein HYE67_002757 [Fusarium culmorum]|uniref:Uncharacterized protein n=1 Tax=Fusarium culmorum TaxID=5516 RepID=A0A7S8D207_FUSCU|nr:hypothetical protein HYE67_002757 [Fusarium culmorum]
MAHFNSTVVTQPFNISILTSNGTGQLNTTKWVIIALFAPELAVFVAATQLHYAWSLKSELLKIKKQRQESPGRKPDPDFEINLKYAFFIVMGAVRFDVHDIFSLEDLSARYRHKFNRTSLDRRSVRSAPASIIWLAERGYWIKVREQDIDDKSKADPVQKALVLIQVLWMVTQCIARRISNLPLSLLEFHTIVHAACAVILYVCWFKKPLDVQEAIVAPTKEYRGELTITLQKHFYADISYNMVLFPPRENEEQPPPMDLNGSKMRWIEPRSGVVMSEGDVLTSGLALSATKVNKAYESSGYCLNPQAEPTGISIIMEPEFLNRWNAISTTYSVEDRRWLIDRIVMRADDQINGTQALVPEQKVLFVPLLKEIEPTGWVTDWQRLFWETESILHLHKEHPSGPRYAKNWKEVFDIKDLTVRDLRFIVLVVTLCGMYGGAHLAIRSRTFPSYVEMLLWMSSCITLASFSTMTSQIIARMEASGWIEALSNH